MLKGLMFWRLESVSQALAPKFRAFGQGLFSQGMANQGAMAHSDTVVRSLRCVPTSAGVYPKLLSVSRLRFVYFYLGRLGCTKRHSDR